MSVELVEVNDEMAAEFLAMAQDYEANGESRYKFAFENFPLYLEQALHLAKGVNLNPDRVRENQLWLIDNGKIVASSRLRHYLNAGLEEEGGHIGYDVRPSSRQKGYGMLILKLTLEKAVELGLEKVLLTCDTDNIASTKIIEKNGGKFAGNAISKRTEKEISRYWIELNQ